MSVNQAVNLPTVNLPPTTAGSLRDRIYNLKFITFLVCKLQITVVRGLLTVNNDPLLPILSNKNLTADHYI